MGLEAPPPAPSRAELAKAVRDVAAERDEVERKMAEIAARLDGPGGAGFEGEQHEFVITVKEAQDKIEEKIPEPMRPMRGRIAMPRDWKADLD